MILRIRNFVSFLFLYLRVLRKVGRVVVKDMTKWMKIFFSYYVYGCIRHSFLGATLKSPEYGTYPLMAWCHHPCMMLILCRNKVWWLDVIIHAWCLSCVGTRFVWCIRTRVRVVFVFSSLSFFFHLYETKYVFSLHLEPLHPFILHQIVKFQLWSLDLVVQAT